MSLLRTHPIETKIMPTQKFVPICSRQLGEGRWDPCVLTEPFPLHLRSLQK